MYISDDVFSVRSSDSDDSFIMGPLVFSQMSCVRKQLVKLNLVPEISIVRLKGVRVTKKSQAFNDTILEVNILNL